MDIAHKGIRMKKLCSVLGLMFLMLITACGEKGQVMDGDGMIQTFEYTQISQDEAREMMAKSEPSIDSNEMQDQDALPATEEATDNSNADAENGGDEMGAAKLLYQGHASMRITTVEGKVIYVDPFAGEGYDVPADLILMTHGHYDHTQTDEITTKNPDG